MQIIITALFLCFVCSPGLAITQKLYDQSVNNTITALMWQHQVPGAAVAIVDHDKSYVYVFGVADKSNNTPVTNKTIFEVGSVTKLFTALTFIIAHGQAALFDPFTKHQMVEDYQKLNNNPYLRQITFEKLLTHTSGLPFGLPENITTIAQIKNYLAQWQPTSAIGTQWQYGNVGIGLVGMALQNTKGAKSVEINQLYKKYILKPLNMPSTGIEIDKKLQSYLAQGYTEAGDAAPHLPNGLFAAAADLKTNIQDVSRFLAVAVGSPAVPSDLRQAMQNAQTPRLAVDGSEQGLVWQIHSLQDKALLNAPEKMNLQAISVKWLPKKQQLFDANKLIDKTGGTPGFRAYVAVIPSKRLGIVILLNKFISNGAIVNAGRKIILER